MRDQEGRTLGVPAMSVQGEHPILTGAGQKLLDVSK